MSVGIKIDDAIPPFDATKIVTVTPLYTMINGLEAAVGAWEQEANQEGTDFAILDDLSFKRNKEIQFCSVANWMIMSSPRPYLPLRIPTSC